MANRCASCKFFRATTNVNKDAGRCHRFPPQRGTGVHEVEGNLVSLPDCDFVLTQRTFWCGEYIDVFMSRRFLKNPRLMPRLMLGSIFMGVATGYGYVIFHLIHTNWG